MRSMKTSSGRWRRRSHASASLRNRARSSRNSCWGRGWLCWVAVAGNPTGRRRPTPSPSGNQLSALRSRAEPAAKSTGWHSASIGHGTASTTASRSSSGSPNPEPGPRDASFAGPRRWSSRMRARSLRRSVLNSVRGHAAGMRWMPSSTTGVLRRPSTTSRPIRTRRSNAGRHTRGLPGTKMELPHPDRATPIVPSNHPPPDAAAELGRQFDLHGRRILRYLARRTDLQSAEDILSETFVTALVRWGSFDPERQEPLPWLFGIATNLLSRHWRSQRRTLRAMSRSATPEHVEDETGDRVDVQRAVQAVVRELDRMRPAVRDTVLLYAWAELTYEQIAAATGVPVGTVRSRLNRARTALRAVPGATDSLNGPLHV
ncbi:hypothetical protein DEJ33_02275 [Curtobacterium sp. MCPF17_047]|nr:hypothetical protein DEJ24_11420 [Curtobacterium sp. MCPF17_001]PZF69204.1 hypothetical protein DEJ33_02275 [Curtobacterium sp. MCPF17_047]